MDEVKLIERIYLGSRDEMIDAINEKRLWIENEFYVPGNIDSKFYEDKMEHYPFIESLYNGTFLFSDVDFADQNFTVEECKEVEDSSKELAVFNLFDSIDPTLNFYFWVKYDFRLMELSMYHDLVANLYHRLPYDTLKIDKSKINEKSIDLMKSLIIGPKGQSVLIISKDKLLNMCYYCPVLVKIFYKKNCPTDLLSSLKEIANKNDIEIEEI
jgi:hypothetical protein